MRLGRAGRKRGSPWPAAVAAGLRTGLAVAVAVAVGTAAAAAPGDSAATSTAAEPVPTATQAGPHPLQPAVEARGAAVVEAEQRLLDLSEQAQRALEEHELALREQDAALAQEQQERERLATAQALVAAKREEMGRWASSTYRSGGVLADFERLMTVLSSDGTDSLAQRLAMLQRVGRMRGDVVDTVTHATVVQQEATRRAEVAAITARVAAERAAAAEAEADALVASQAAQVETVRLLLAETVSQAERDGFEQAQLAAARVLADRRSAAAGDGEPGSCVGGDTARYPNGAIPLAALCPLWGAPDQHLRADAAAGFDRLSEAFATRFGVPLCVTDSYRTLDEQVRVRAAKPHLAATPGTSNHGWGTAVDLCGGVQHFGSAEHLWLRAHAPLHGFFHPAWARADGSKPEPWHWEFGG